MYAPAIVAFLRPPPPAEVIRLDDYRNPPRQLDLFRNYEIAGRSGDAEHLRRRAPGSSEAYGMITLSHEIQVQFYTIIQQIATNIIFLFTISIYFNH